MIDYNAPGFGTAAPQPVDDAPFVVELDSFSGPLDLLLHLIREQEIDIADIPIARVAEQFRQVIHQLGLNQAAEYLEMAARLLRIKIQLLLPRPLDDEDWEDPRAELVRRLLEYEQMREVSRWLAEQAGLQSARFARGWVAEPPPSPPAEIVIDIEGLLQAVERAIDGLPEPIIHRVVPRPLDVEGATRRIRELIAVRSRLEFAEILGERPHVADVISALVALLELARLGELRLLQPKPMTSLTISNESTHQTG